MTATLVMRNMTENRNDEWMVFNPFLPESFGDGVSASASKLRTIARQIQQTYFQPQSRSDALFSTFQFYKDNWIAERSWVSSARELENSQWYRAIIHMGPLVVPYILEELAHNPDHWFSALEEITCDDPIPDEHYGNLEAMAADWIRWSKERC